MVDKKFRIKQWSGHDSASPTDTNADRYLQERLRCSVSRNKNWGSVVKEGTEVPYKSFRMFINKICTSNLQQTKDGRDKDSETSQSFEGDLGLSSQTSDHDYCRVLPRLPKSLCILGVEKSKEFYRVEIMSASIPENLSECGSTRVIDLSASQLPNQLPGY